MDSRRVPFPPQIFGIYKIIFNSIFILTPKSPICQESLLSPPSPLTHCKLSCGNSIHVKCMKVLMDHQVGALGMANVKCPLCRNDFGSFESLQLEFSDIVKADCLKKKTEQRKPRHPGFRCHECSSNPILGKCHTCTTCPMFHLCDGCFTKGAHAEHTFQHRNYRGGASVPSSRAVVPMLPQGFISDLETREITDQDYETLRMLDSGPVQQTFIPLHVINSFPVFKISSISLKNEILPGGKCNCCAIVVGMGEMVRKIPCGHAFHKDCIGNDVWTAHFTLSDPLKSFIDRWLLKQRTTCPSCGLAAYSSLGQDDVGDEDIQPEEARYAANSYNIPQTKRPKAREKVVDKEYFASQDANMFEIVGFNSSASQSSSLGSLRRLNEALPRVGSKGKFPAIPKKSGAIRSGASISRPMNMDELFISTSSSAGNTNSNSEGSLQTFTSSPVQKRRTLTQQSKANSRSTIPDLDSLIQVNVLRSHHNEKWVYTVNGKKKPTLLVR